MKVDAPVELVRKAIKMALDAYSRRFSLFKAH